MARFAANIPEPLRRLLSGQGMGQALQRAVMRTALEARDLLADATPKDTGDTARRWQITKVPTATDASAVVSNDSVIMTYLEYGTPPHKITAKNGKALAFKSGQVGTGTSGRTAGRALYRTSAGRLSVQRNNAATVLVQSVNHPGTRPTFVVRNLMPVIRQRLIDNANAEIRGIING